MKDVDRKGQSPCQRLTHWNDTLQVQPRTATITQTGCYFKHKIPVINIIITGNGDSRKILFYTMSSDRCRTRFKQTAV